MLQFLVVSRAHSWEKWKWQQLWVPWSVIIQLVIASSSDHMVCWWYSYTSAAPNAVQFLGVGCFFAFGTNLNCTVDNAISLFSEQLPIRILYPWEPLRPTHSLDRDLPRIVYKELGSMVGAVGECLEFTFVAAACSTDGSALYLWQ